MLTRDGSNMPRWKKSAVTRTAAEGFSRWDLNSPSLMKTYLLRLSKLKKKVKTMKTLENYLGYLEKFPLKNHGEWCLKEPCLRVDVEIRRLQERHSDTFLWIVNHMVPFILKLLNMKRGKVRLKRPYKFVRKDYNSTWSMGHYGSNI